MTRSHHNLMRPHSLNRVITSRHFGDDGVVIVGIKPSPVPHLPASLGIKRRVIENDLARFASLEFLHSLPVMNDGQHLAPIRPRLPISFKLRFRKLLIRRIRRLLRRTFPRSPRARLLLFHRAIEAGLIEFNALIARRILHEIQRHPERVVELERILACELSPSRARFSSVSSFSQAQHPWCARTAFPRLSTAFDTRSAVSFSSGYASFIRSRTAKTI